MYSKMIRASIAVFGMATVALFSTQSASATTFTYDFKAEAESTGDIGEAIFSTFSTSTGGVFAGPNLDITASKNNIDAFVYFDAGNAGMGVCGVPSNIGQVGQYAPGSGNNRCNPSSDDGLTTTEEVLHFKATDTAVLIESIYLNSNHDNAPIGSTVWNFGGTQYNSASPAWSVASLSGSGDIKIDVNFFLAAGQTVTLRGVQGPDSYLSGISLSPVPLPASVLLLGAGLAGLGALRRRRKPV